MLIGPVKLKLGNLSRCRDPFYNHLAEDPAGPELMARDNADKDSLRAAASCNSICLW